MAGLVKGREKTLLIFAFLVLLPALVYCLPEGQQVVSGNATFDASKAGTLNINTSSDKLIINYNSFNVGQNEAVNFHQPSASSVALNRIIGADPSSILGTINANGRIFIINPNGILFGPGSHVNAAGLLASTLDISNADFLAGKYNFSGTKGNILNQGILNANTPGGYIALLAPSVENQGSIAVASLGTIALAAGEAATISLDSKGLISVALTKPTSTNPNRKDAALKNSGSLKADGGTIILNAQALNQVFNDAINNSGVIQANTLVNQNGTVKLIANGNVEETGSITASNLTVDVTGTVNAKGPIKLTKDFTLISGNFISDVAQAFSVGGSFSLPGGIFSRFGYSQSIIDNQSVTIYLIYDIYGLQAMKDHLSWNFALSNNIDATPTRTWNWDPTRGVYLGFEPVGQSSPYFSGILDGHKYRVNGLYINRTTNNIGLFGKNTAQSEIKNIGLVNCDITGWEYAQWVGALIGVNYGSISNAYASGSVKDEDGDIGGLVGFNSGSISKSYATVTVNANPYGDGHYVGGLVGVNNGSIFQSYATGSVQGFCFVGGLVGNNSGSVVQSYATGNAEGLITIGWGIGGLVGHNTGGTISDCYAKGNVQGKSGIGGLVGINQGGDSISRSYAVGRVTASEINVGGLVGYCEGSINYSANFWNRSINPGLLDVGNLGDLPDNQIAAKTTAEMKQKQTYLDAGWDFTNIWTIIEGSTYPYFKWQIPPSVVMPPVSADSINPAPGPVPEDKKVLALAVKRSKQR